MEQNETTDIIEPDEKSHIESDFPIREWNIFADMESVEDPLKGPPSR